jgi:hypothetical protein
MVKLLFHVHGTDFESLLLLGAHKRIWDQYGKAILDGFEKVTGLAFTQGIRVELLIAAEGEEGSHSGTTNREAIRLAYTSPNVNEIQILWLLCHELGHRLLGQHKIYLNDTRNELQKRTNMCDAHRALFIILIEVINTIFTPGIARQLFERADYLYAVPDVRWDDAYQKAWQWARGLSPLRRRQLISTIAAEKTLKLLDV